MAYELVATPISGQKAVTLRLGGKQEIKTGADHKTRFLAQVVRNGITRSIAPVIEKTLAFSIDDFRGEHPELSVQHYERMWRAYRNAGLNVVRWIRRTDRNTLVMPDLTAGGSALYGKAAQRMQNESRLYGLDRRQPHPLDSAFLQLTDNEHFTDIMDEVREAVRKANLAGIALPTDEDAFELVLHPEQPGDSWELVTLDLALSSERAPGSPDIARSNRRMAVEFLTDLQQIRAGIMLPEGQELDWQQRYNTRDTISSSF